ncbi:magnesium transporter [Trichophyton mentagrophytes]|nr:magnesium transporter [Trichophyton mentagrophytes]
MFDEAVLAARSGGSPLGSPNSRPPAFKAVGITLAVCSGLFIGISFVLKKVGLLKANVKYNEEAGEGYGYLKNFYWWAGMTLMILGELCNFVAYAFVDAILVTPLGALSVVVTTVLSAIFLKERLSFVGKVGCVNCIIGSVIIAMNAPTQSSVANIQDMRHYVITPGFLSFAGVIIVVSAFLAIWAGPRYGKKSMFVYLTICSLTGGLSVVATQGLGAAIIAQIMGTPQFKEWFLWVLLVFIVATLLTEIIYLNKALNLFNAAMVTPTYYVIFTSACIVTSAVLFQGFKGTVISITTVVMGFLQICTGVVLLQLSKSAKDVPDAAVFKGDLDQVREVAEQEEGELEPKADAIRGTAAIIRRISTPRQKMEQEEIRRFHMDQRLDELEPVGENEIIEWDGLRRRRTTLVNGAPATSPRRRVQHPPLGMSRFPDYSEPEVRTPREGLDGSFIGSIRKRASTALHPYWRPSGTISPQPMEKDGRLDSPKSMPERPSESGPFTRHELLQAFQYNKAIRRPRSETIDSVINEKSRREEKAPLFDGSNDNSNANGNGDSKEKAESTSPPPTPPAHRAHRQFSFNVFRRNSSSAPPAERLTTPTKTPHLHLPHFISHHSHPSSSSKPTTTEEEALGLSSGDKGKTRSPSPQAKAPSRPEKITRHSHGNSSESLRHVLSVSSSSAGESSSTPSPSQSQPQSVQHTEELTRPLTGTSEQDNRDIGPSDSTCSFPKFDPSTFPHSAMTSSPEEARRGRKERRGNVRQSYDGSHGDSKGAKKDDKNSSKK